MRVGRETNISIGAILVIVAFIAFAVLWAVGR